MSPLRRVEFCLEDRSSREIWGTLSLPEKTEGPVIVMAHGFLGFKDWSFFPWLADLFAQAGFPVLRFNFSGSGMGPQSDGPFNHLEAFEKDTISRQVEDLRAVFAALLNGRFEPDLPPQKNIFLWGHSRGGAVCILSAVNQPAVKAIATWATISRVNRYFYEAKREWRQKGFSNFESSRTGQSLRYSLDFLDDAEQWGSSGDVPTYLHHLKVPVLFVHGSEDTSVPPEESESLAAVHPWSSLVILAGANHKFNASHPFMEPPSVLLEAAQQTLDFYRKA